MDSYEPLETLTLYSDLSITSYIIQYSLYASAQAGSTAVHLGNCLFTRVVGPSFPKAAIGDRCYRVLTSLKELAKGINTTIHSCLFGAAVDFKGSQLQYDEHV